MLPQAKMGRTQDVGHTDNTQRGKAITGEAHAAFGNAIEEWGYSLEMPQGSGGHSLGTPSRSAMALMDH